MRSTLRSAIVSTAAAITLACTAGLAPAADRVGEVGVDWTGKSQGPMLNSYIRLEHEAAPRHVLFNGLEDAPRIINGVSRLEVKIGRAHV